MSRPSLTPKRDLYAMVTAKLVTTIKRGDRRNTADLLAL
jgi:hypothetical protein